jgi:hypothetical protein
MLKWAETADARPVELEPDHTGVRKKESNGKVKFAILDTTDADCCILI